MVPMNGALYSYYRAWCLTAPVLVQAGCPYGDRVGVVQGLTLT